MIQNGRFGDFGGVFVPQILLPALEQLESAWLAAAADAEFQQELTGLLQEYAGRPTPLYRCRNLCSETTTRIYLKREDLLHGGAHKTNQVLAQAMLARRMGKRRLIAETGAGQHGTATAMAGALFGLETVIYMGARDVERQQQNVYRMELMGARVVAVEKGSRTLKDAINEALRDWAANFADTHYLLGTVAGPHPFPTMVRDFQRVIGQEARTQILQQEGRLPDAVIACVGGGSNAMGVFHDFVPDPEVELVGVEAYGHGLHTDAHCATLHKGSAGILHGARSNLLQDEQGQVLESHSVAAGLDYPGVGPEHAWLQASGRARYVGIEDQVALQAFYRLSREEGIIPALESAHALAHAIRRAESGPGSEVLVVNLSGRGDKDLDQVRNLQIIPANDVGSQSFCPSDAGTSLRSGEAPACNECGVQGLRPWQGAGDRVPVSSRYENMFAALAARNEGAFIPFVMLGDPDDQQSLEIIRTLVTSGADALELGIPFSDPVADGPVIQQAGLRALAAGSTPERCFALLKKIRAEFPGLPIGLLVYANLVHRHGYTEFYSVAAAAGVDSVLVADVPTIEAAAFCQAAEAAGVAPVLIAAATLPSEMLRDVARLSQGYTYVVTRVGVTGVDDRQLRPPEELLKELQKAGAPPAVLGFGISRPEQVKAVLASGAAGAISGSAIVRIIAEHEKNPAQLHRALSEFGRMMKAATKKIAG